MKDYKERNNFILRTKFWNASFPSKMCFKSAPQKLNFLIEKAISKIYTLDSSCKIYTLDSSFFLVRTIEN